MMTDGTGGDAMLNSPLRPASISSPLELAGKAQWVREQSADSLSPLGSEPWARGEEAGGGGGH